MESKGFNFHIHGNSDSDYAMKEDDHKSISGGRIFWEGCSVVFPSSTQKFVTSSVTEAEYAAGLMIAQDMPYVYRLLLSLGLKV